MIFVHGPCMNDLQWSPSAARKGVQTTSESRDYVIDVARAEGYTPIFLHFNSGLHISINGEEFANLLEKLWQAWPQPISELSLIAHSMGGLVSRAACHQAEMAGYALRSGLKNVIFLGRPHHGAPLELLGNWVDTVLSSNPVTRPSARIGHIRSAGITDLRCGNVLEADWQGSGRFDRAPDARLPLPLPEGVSCFAVAASTLAQPAGTDALKFRLANQLLGDGMVPVSSALCLHDDDSRQLGFPAEHQWTAWQTGHMKLLHSEAVAARLRRWLTPLTPS